MSTWYIPGLKIEPGKWFFPPLSSDRLIMFKPHESLKVFCVLCGYADINHTVDMSYVELGKHCGLHKETVMKAVVHLESIGAIKCAERTKHPRIRLKTKTRWRVFKRDQYRCVYCGEDTGPFEVDHVNPVANGGNNSLDNLVTACIKCNRNKRIMTADVFRQWLKDQTPRQRDNTTEATIE